MVKLYQVTQNLKRIGFGPPCLRFYISLVHGSIVKTFCGDAKPFEGHKAI